MTRRRRRGLMRVVWLAVLCVATVAAGQRGAGGRTAPAPRGGKATAAITHGRDIRDDPGRVGLRVATTRTVPGYDFGDLNSLRRFGANIRGSGTAADPWTVDRVLFTGQVIVGNSAAGHSLKGRYFRFTRCRFQGEPSNPTRKGSFYVGTRVGEADVAGLWLEDCEVGPDAAIAPDGGPDPASGGCDKAVQSWVPLILRRCNVWGAAILVYLETERDEADSVVEDCWLHDVWSSAGDHTDLVNGNFHASHVTVRRCYLNGTRTGGTYVTNGFGIYDDPNTAAGLCEDWTIESCYVTHCATFVLSGHADRMLDPFVVKGNVWTGDFTVARFRCRPPSEQSDNRDEKGTALKL